MPNVQIAQKKDYSRPQCAMWAAHKCKSGRARVSFSKFGSEENAIISQTLYVER